jgi:hypothetical protein
MVFVLIFVKVLNFDKGLCRSCPQKKSQTSAIGIWDLKILEF